jgi:hypothetical protein
MNSDRITFFKMRSGGLIRLLNSACVRDFFFTQPERRVSTQVQKQEKDKPQTIVRQQPAYKNKQTLLAASNPHPVVKSKGTIETSTL